MKGSLQLFHINVCRVPEHPVLTEYGENILLITEEIINFFYEAWVQYTSHDLTDYGDNCKERWYGQFKKEDETGLASWLE